MSDIFEACGTEEGVGHCVRQDVGVGVAEETPIERDLDSTEYEAAAVLSRSERVDVHTQSDTHQGQTSWVSPSRAASMASANTRSSGEVSLMLVFSPATTSTRPPSRSTREASSVAARRYSSGESWRRRSKPRRKA